MKTLILALAVLFTVPAFAQDGGVDAGTKPQVCNGLMVQKASVRSALIQLYAIQAVLENHPKVTTSGLLTAEDESRAAAVTEQMEWIASGEADVACLHITKEDAGSFLNAVGAVSYVVVKVHGEPEIGRFMLKNFGKAVSIRIIDDGVRFMKNLSIWVDSKDI